MKRADSAGHDRREFLKRVVVTGGAATAAAAGGQAIAETSDAPGTETPAAAKGKQGYRVTEHVEQYYRLARF